MEPIRIRTVLLSGEPRVDDLVEGSRDRGVVAVGETGLDYFRSKGDLGWQKDRFRVHIRAAKIAKLPLIVHSRSAKEDTIEILRSEGADECSGVMHCFTEDWPMAVAALDLGFYISFSGIVTFRNAPRPSGGSTESAGGSLTGRDGFAVSFTRTDARKEK